jgi:HAD superfamily phosphoserine phosphatase-like hydrolase
MKWLAVLDMDGTILEQRTVDVLSERLGLATRLRQIDEKSKSLKAYEVSARIAMLFSGIRASKMKEIFETIPTVNGAEEFIGFLKSRSFITAVVTDSYTFLASTLAQKLNIDVVRGNELEIVRDIVTGRIAMPLGWEHEEKENCQKKAICKLHVMKSLVKKHSIKRNRTLAVGDSEADLCMLQEARIGVAFRPKDKSIIKVADVVIRSDFCALSAWLKTFLDTFGN